MYYDKNKKKKQSVIVLLLILAVCAGGGFLLFEKFRNVGDVYIIRGNGRIEGRETVIATKFSGRIIDLKADEGDVVKKGDLLAIIDHRAMISDLEAQKARVGEIKSSIASINANIKGTKSNIEFFKKEVGRSKALIKQNFASQLELDKNINSLDQSRAQLASLEAQSKSLKAQLASLQASIKTAEINIEDMKIYAPTNGIILYRLVEKGEMLGNNGRLFIMYNPDDLFMTIFMPSNMAGKVKLGDESLVRVDAFRNDPLKAKVTFVAENAEFTPKEVETQTEREKLVFRVKLTLVDNEARKAKPGMPGDGFIKIDKARAWPSLEKMK